MKTLINLLLIFSTSLALAEGVSGGGGGPRPEMSAFKSGGDGSGGAPRPRMDAFHKGGDGSGGAPLIAPRARLESFGNTPKAVPRFDLKSKENHPNLNTHDYVKSLDLKGNNIRFHYRSPEKLGISTESIEINELDSKYLKALMKSLKENNWQEVEIER